MGFQDLRAMLGRAQAKAEQIERRGVLAHATPATMGALDVRIRSMNEKIDTVRKSLCARDQCKEWGDFRDALSVAATQFNGNDFDGSVVSSYRASAYTSLLEFVESQSSTARANIARRVLEESIAAVNPKCTTASADPPACLRHVVDVILDSDLFVFNVDNNDAMVENIAPAVRDGDSAARDRAPLQSRIHELVLSAEFLARVGTATAGSLREGDVYNLSTVLIKKILQQAILQRKEEFELLDNAVQTNSGASVSVSGSGSASVATPEKYRHLIDHAIAPRGGRVVTASKKAVHHLTSPPYVPSFLKSVGLLGGYEDPSVVISNSFPPDFGDCYAFPGASGNVTVLLPAPTVILRIGVYQRSEGEGAAETASAPRSFRVHGWPALPPELAPGKKHTFGRQIGSFPMGVFTLESLQQRGTFQQFALRGVGGGEPESVHAVTIEFTGNFGNEEFTCVYRVQLLGDPLSDLS
jgi:hypothetical protein